MLELILKILLASFCGYIYSEHWTKAGMIFNHAYNFAEVALPKWIFKPLIGCFRCVCAQWAMWTYIVQTVVCHASNFNFFHMAASALIGTAIGIISHKLLNDE